ncbi:kinase-like protein [Metschnikowia bicuspidata var. bicuspidata NRRL YB-4993]|uniref:Kinase-like protein n=1 Tax=Metschnikowia bicuspidata var. bicuspidata NRRL YB-4993 TaxID=869754 RepID=A0A1A0H617_9ASCO|nr:kinase-like protein [Metschnikowia bicuspidata var. bicuspidata NRRL YB-4993]OBA19400.1 kinase-like protein [Metschnikowia bicuspidata var. bicuspidata NRRL YB-4993]
MDITHSLVHLSRSRSRSRTRNSTANSRSTSSSRRPSLGGNKRSLSSSSINRFVITPTQIDPSSEKTIPTINLNLDNTLPLDFFKQELIGLIRALRISKWRKVHLSPEHIVISRILGALTNSIYKIEYKDSDCPVQPPLLLLRVYGKNVDNLIDRDSELETLIKLSSNKIGPKLLGIFGNGRFEQFLEGFVTLGKEDIRDPVISQILGRRMKDLHYNIKLDERDKCLELPLAWLQIMKWILLFENNLLHVLSEKTVEETLLMPWLKFRSLVFAYRNWLFSKYDETALSDNYRFCHNDTQYGNLLIKSTFNPKDVVQSDGDLPSLNTSNRRDADLAVIDFEYSGANFPAFDIADHFSEWMSDYHDEEKPYYIHEDKYPTQTQQFNLLKSYVEYNFQFPSSNLKTKTQFRSRTDDIKSLMEHEVKKLYNEIIYWRATVQIFWLVWGLIQSGPTKDPIEDLASTTSGKGVLGTYEYSTGIDALKIAQDGPGPLEEEAITSTDDDFDYLKYSQQKAALIVGDLVSFGLLPISDIAPRNHNMIKFLDTKSFDV